MKVYVIIVSLFIFTFCISLSACKNSTPTSSGIDSMPNNVNSETSNVNIHSNVSSEINNNNSINESNIDNSAVSNCTGSKVESNISSNNFTNDDEVDNILNNTESVTTSNTETTVSSNSSNTTSNVSSSVVDTSSDKNTTSKEETTNSEVDEVESTVKLTFKEYMNLSAQEREEFFNTFDSVQDFVKWYKLAQENYEKNSDSIKISGFGSLDLSEYIK